MKSFSIDEFFLGGGLLGSTGIEISQTFILQILLSWKLFKWKSLCIEYQS